MFKNKKNLEKEFNEFFKYWQKIVYLITETDYETAWEKLQEVYSQDNLAQIQYLWETWLCVYKKKFVKFWTNQVLHFNNIATSCAESEHSVLK